MKDFRKHSRIGMVSTAIAAAIIGSFGMVYAPVVASADGSTPYYMAPPVDENVAPVDDSAAPPPTTAAALSTPSASTVFNWQEVPANQKVPINRAAFDKGGYQLYDSVGETILVPFKNDNLYVMKFAVSPDGTTYFVNSGSAPILYLPQNGYVENATASGGKWYPFTQDFDPTTPVFLGCAPSWPVFIDTGWYPNMCCYGGYWCGTSVGIFTPSLGFNIAFGNNCFYSWGDYCGYADIYPAPFFVGFYFGDWGFGGHQYWGGRSFHGGYGHWDSNRGFGGGSHFNGASARSGDSYGYHVQEHTFRGAVGSYNVSHSGSFSGGDFRGGGFSGGNFRTNDSGSFHGGGSGGGNYRTNDSGSFHGGGSGGGNYRTNDSGSFHGGGGGGGFRDGGHR
jgi:hypothetical protein